MNGNVVRVVLWGETVGYLTWNSTNWRTTTAVFSFAKDFFDKGLYITEKNILAVARENDINNPSGIISQALDVVSDFRSYCEDVDVSNATYDIMQKELNEKYNSFR